MTEVFLIQDYRPDGTFGPPLALPEPVREDPFDAIREIFARRDAYWAAEIEWQAREAEAEKIRAAERDLFAARPRWGHGHRRIATLIGLA